MKVFLFGESGDKDVNDFRLRKYLMEIIPSTNNVLEVLRKKSKFEEFNFTTVQNVLDEYKVTINDFVHSQLIEIMTILRNNISRDIKESEKNDRNYTRLLKKSSRTKKSRGSFISDKSLKDVEIIWTLPFL